MCDASFGAPVALDLILQRMDALFTKVNTGAEIFFLVSLSGPQKMACIGCQPALSFPGLARCLRERTFQMLP